MCLYMSLLYFIWIFFFFFKEPVLQVTSVTFLEYVIKSDNSGPVYSEILTAFPGDPDKCILET